jgi:hypothetical protein
MSSPGLIHLCFLPEHAVALSSLLMLPQNPNDEPYFYQLQAQSTRKLESGEYAICQTYLQYNTGKKILLTTDFCGFFLLKSLATQNFITIKTSCNTNG